MKKWIFLIFFAALLLSCWGSYLFLRQEKSAKCDFFRDGQCLMCETQIPILVGYKENCEKCPNRVATYIEDGVVPSWLCQIQSEEQNGVPHPPLLKRGSTKCPKQRPLKDAVGNCHACDTEDILRVAEGASKVCAHRYILPDGFLEKSIKCPDLMLITDPEVCVMCGGIMNGTMCEHEGKNHFCKDNTNCDANEWCYPFKHKEKRQGVCIARPQTKWFCSQTDGYNLETAKKFCARLGSHIPSLEEIEFADEDLSALCPTLDMWTFFSDDGVVWLQSFTQEFLFTREGESEKLGGHQFYALCHKD